MTHTTTDAAEARAETGIERVRRRRAERDASGVLYVDSSIYEGMEACLVRNGRAVAHVRRYADAVEIAAMLATVEAASGAGEREAALRLAVESEIETRFWSIVDQEGPTTVPSDMWNALQTIMNKCRRHDAALASLPPATDPAKPSSEMLDAAEREGWDRAAAEEIWTAMSLAAAPTIPATGEDGWTDAGRAWLAAGAPISPSGGKTMPVIDVKMLAEVMQDAWGEICDDAGAHPLDMKHGRGSVLFYSPGHWTDLIALRLNERLSATGHAATEGEK